MRPLQHLQRGLGEAEERTPHLRPTRVLFESRCCKVLCCGLGLLVCGEAGMELRLRRFRREVISTRGSVSYLAYLQHHTAVNLLKCDVCCCHHAFGHKISPIGVDVDSQPPRLRDCSAALQPHVTFSRPLHPPYQLCVIICGFWSLVALLFLGSVRSPFVLSRHFHYPFTNMLIYALSTAGGRKETQKWIMRVQEIVFP